MGLSGTRERPRGGERPPDPIARLGACRNRLLTVHRLTGHPLAWNMAMACLDAQLRLLRPAKT